MPRKSDIQDPETAGFFAGDLLRMAKTFVRSYSIAVIETATPNLREVLTKQLVAGIQLNENVFSFMLQRGYYPFRLAINK